MELVAKPATEKGPADRFIGDVWMDIIVRGEEPSHVRAGVVRFAPGAHSAWHAHPVGQTLYVTEGVGRIQAREGNVLEIRAGDTVLTRPGEWHWHGAAPDHFMTHIAIWEAPPEGAESDWGDHISEAEYHADPA